ncbi:MAG: MlaC/ttg2D family ABC transporter substrate-binding protein [Saccharospirillum sp.]
MVYRAGAIFLALMLALVARAEDFTPSQSPEQSVLEGIEAVRTVVAKYSELDNDNGGDRSAFMEEVAEVLEPLVGYTVIVSRIMGDTLEQATPQQRLRFLNTFKRSMVRTYAGGLYNLGSFDVQLLDNQRTEEDTVRNTRVFLEVVSPQGQRYPMVQSLYYSQSADGWRMQNVIFNGINLGVTFRTQFEQLLRENNGDLDATIEAWEAMTEASFEEEEFSEE